MRSLVSGAVVFFRALAIGRKTMFASATP